MCNLFTVPTGDKTDQDGVLWETKEKDKFKKLKTV